MGFLLIAGQLFDILLQLTTQEQLIRTVVIPAQTTAKMSDDENISIYDEIEIEDMTFDEAMQVYHYPCPCGDKFQIALDDLLDEQDIAVCPSCSLMIRVIFDLVSLRIFLWFATMLIILLRMISLSPRLLDLLVARSPSPPKLTKFLPQTYRRAEPLPP